ncbi:MAG TPA: hypothetical protein VKS60_11385 [Stellaceae bacterium]|nr:hypothetical protein [Stellaceae bacterium]
MKLKVGARLRSAVCDTEAVVVRIPGTDEQLFCGGAAMLPHDQARDPAAVPAPDAAEGSQLGKRYVDVESGAELLCTKAGKGSLALGGRKLTIREAKRLPSSD